MKSYRIATIPGDGIGKEVVPEGIRVLETAGRKHGFTLQWTQLPWSSEFYQKTGQMMPADGLDQLKEHDAIFLGAVGFPPIDIDFLIVRENNELPGYYHRVPPAQNLVVWLKLTLMGSRRTCSRSLPHRFRNCLADLDRFCCSTQIPRPRSVDQYTLDRLQNRSRGIWFSQMF
jgi:Isocitrate/isopropylmalate dehydrogenase